MFAPALRVSPILLWALLLAPTSIAAETTISPGKAIAITYTADAPTLLAFGARAGDFARIEVIQSKGNARVVANLEDGTFMRSVNRTDSPEIETADIIVSSEGKVVLEISAARGNDEGGEAIVEITDLRPATHEETVGIGAEMALDDGDRLMSDGSSEALGQAIVRYEEARRLFAESGNRQMEGVALDSSGWVHDMIGEKRKAIELYREALVIRREVGDLDGEIFTLLGIGLVYNYLGDVESALETNQHALELARDAGARRHEADLLHNIGGLHWAIDEMQVALDYYRKALEIRRELDDPLGMAGTLNNIGDVYRRLGDYDRAMEYFTSALSIREEAGNKRGMAHSLHTMGLVYAAKGEWEKARETYQRGLDLRRETADKRGIAFSLGGLADADFALGRTAESIRNRNEALELWREMGEIRSEGESLWRLGLMLVDLEKLDEARLALDRGLEIARAMRDRSSEASALYGLARLDRKSGELEAARAHIEEAIEIVESLRGKIASDDLRASYLASVANFYDFYVSLQMHLHRQEPDKGHDAGALETSERARARSLIDALSTASVESLEADARLSEKEKELRKRIHLLDKQVMKLAPEKGQATELALAQTKLDAALAEYRIVLDEIRSADSRFADLMGPRTLTLEEIQSFLDDETVLLEIALGQHESFLWIVSRESLTSVTLPTRNEIDTLARELYSSLTARNELRDGESLRQRSERIATSDEHWRTSSAQLATMLLGSVVDSIANKRIVVVSDGVLQYLPFAAFPDPGSENGEPLLVRHEIVTLPSASLLPLLRSERTRSPIGNRVAIIADPVFREDDSRVEQVEERETASGEGTDPNYLLQRSAAEVGLSGFPRLRFSRREADAITGLLEPGLIFRALDFDASLDAVNDKTLQSSRIVHLATHGILNSRNPELSGLVLSLVDPSGHPREGFLNLGDIYRLRLDAELVVLSACQTALGREIRGEGLIGLTRGFMYAGAPRVISSLWRVDDRATAELMKRVYQKLLDEQLPPASALRGAQLEMSKNDRWSSPYYWGAFSIQGDWR